MTNSASKQYVINQLPTDSSEIQSLSTMYNFGGTVGTLTIYYWKVGKLYFGFSSGRPGDSVSAGVVFGSDASNLSIAEDTIDEFASIIGETVSEYYIAKDYGPQILAYSSGTWSIATPVNTNRLIVFGFLST